MTCVYVLVDVGDAREEVLDEELKEENETREHVLETFRLHGVHQLHEGEHDAAKVGEQLMPNVTSQHGQQPTHHARTTSGVTVFTFVH